MKTALNFAHATLVVAVLSLAGCGGPSSSEPALHAEAATSASRLLARNDSGIALTIRVGGGPVVDRTNPFFQSLGTNGRSCDTCHRADQGMTVTPESVRDRFEATNGTDPIFRTNDGSVSPTADVSTVDARRAAFRLLLDRGLIRVGLPIPAGAEFELASVNDPYGYASSSELSLFRRPLPAANLKFLSTVMWDGRETFRDASQSTGFAPLAFDLSDQANGATLGHAQASAPLTQAQRDAIVQYETQIFTAQSADDEAGALTAAGATGGPDALSTQPFYFGINDVLGADPTGAAFTPIVMSLYESWNYAFGRGGSEARRSVARGEAIFNTHPIDITGVAGINDDLGVPVLHGTCTTCHDAPNAGDHSVPAPLAIGTSDATPPALDVSGLPVYTLRNLTTGEIKVVTDPGRALITGKWKDVGRIKGPVLRGLSSRAPYFHNGSAKTIEDAVSFYDARFSIHFTEQEKTDLVAFLRTL